MGLDQWLSKNGATVITWRKCNQIHGYFDRVCKGVENLEEYTVKIEDLVKLRDTCKEVINNHDDGTCKELLPVMKGCFFGSYCYDDWYYGDVEWTMNELDKIISNHTDEDYYTYQAWW